MTVAWGSSYFTPTQTVWEVKWIDGNSEFHPNFVYHFPHTQSEGEGNRIMVSLLSSYLTPLPPPGEFK